MKKKRKAARGNPKLGLNHTVKPLRINPNITMESENAMIMELDARIYEIERMLK